MVGGLNLSVFQFGCFGKFIYGFDVQGFGQFNIAKEFKLGFKSIYKRRFLLKNFGFQLDLVPTPVPSNTNVPIIWFFWHYEFLCVALDKENIFKLLSVMQQTRENKTCCSIEEKYFTTQTEPKNTMFSQSYNMIPCFSYDRP